MQNNMKFAVLFSLVSSTSILHAQEMSIIPVTFPEGFRGMVVYDGIVKGTAVVAPQGGAGININGGNVQLDLGGLFNRALNKRTVPLHGTWHVEAEYEGNRVRGRSVVQSEIDGLSEDTSFVGTRNGDICSLSFNGETPQRITCTPIRFESNVDYTDQNRNKIKASYIASRTSAVDYVERDRLAAIEQAKREREAAAARRAEAAEAARLAALPRATPAQIRLLADAIGQDSGNWWSNRYDVGSLNNVRVDSSGGVIALRGDYTYNGGSQGWIKGRIERGRVQCIQYHDTSDCAEVRQSGSSNQKEILETIKIDNYRWVHLNRAQMIGGSKSFDAAADIRKAGDIVTFIKYFIFKRDDGTLSRGLFTREEVNCVQFTIKTITSGRLNDDKTVDFRDDPEPASYGKPGTYGRFLIDSLCSLHKFPTVTNVTEAAEQLIDKL